MWRAHGALGWALQYAPASDCMFVYEVGDSTVNLYQKIDLHSNKLVTVEWHPVFPLFVVATKQYFSLYVLDVEIAKAFTQVQNVTYQDVLSA